MMPRSESIGVRAVEFCSPAAMRIGCSKGDRVPRLVARAPSSFDGSNGALGGAGWACGGCCAATTPESATVPSTRPMPPISARRERRCPMEAVILSSAVRVYGPVGGGKLLFGFGVHRDAGYHEPGREQQRQLQE